LSRWPGRLLVSRCGDLAGHGDRDQAGGDHEHEAQVRGGPGGGPSEPFDRLLNALRPPHRSPRRLGDQAEHQTGHEERDDPAGDHRAREAERQPGLPPEQERARLGRVPAREYARPEVALPRHSDRDDDQYRHKGDDGDECEGSRSSQRTELFDPSEWAQPSKPGQLGVRVGGHPDQVGRGKDARPEQVGVPPGRGELAEEHADGHEHCGGGQERGHEEHRGSDPDVHLGGRSDGESKEYRRHP
jgi:hypothetical protein